MRPRRLLQRLGLLDDPGDWLEPDRLLACRYARRDAALARLSDCGIAVLVNLHERRHDPARLDRHNMVEVHIPGKDFSPPSPGQVAIGVAAIDRAIAAGDRVAVPCGGLGRTGTLLACYLVNHGLDPAEAIRRVRAARPGSVETARQVAAVEAYARGFALR